ncbi:MAG: polyprenyl synthetase family protein [Coriobacteriales bacterium]
MDFKDYLSEHASSLDDDLAAPYTADLGHDDLSRYLTDPLRAFVENGGKRFRPLICRIACELVGGDADDALVAACAIEQFHSAALVHDDIADESELRRGRPCLHRTEGVGAAVNDGDYALTVVTGSVAADPRLSDATKVRVIAELSEMMARTVEGQALDIGWARDQVYDLSVDDYLFMATHKTAFYSGGTPLAIGGIIGGGTDKQVEGLRTFGLETGLAFQIQDDLLNLVGGEEARRKDFRSDITEGKRTLVMVHALGVSSHADELVAILSSKTTDPARLERAVQIARDSGSIAYAREYARTLVERGKARLRWAFPDRSEQRELLLSMADFFVERLS